MLKDGRKREYLLKPPFAPLIMAVCEHRGKVITLHDVTNCTQWRKFSEKQNMMEGIHEAQPHDHVVHNYYMMRRVKYE